jgi:hypothetical protein
MIYKATGNLRAIQILLGHSKIENTVRYLGVDVEDALLLAERTCCPVCSGKRTDMFRTGTPQKQPFTFLASIGGNRPHDGRSPGPCHPLEADIARVPPEVVATARCNRFHLRIIVFGSGIFATVQLPCEPSHTQAKQNVS